MNAVPPALVEVDHVRQRYPKGSGEDLLVLDDVSLELRDNEIVSLLGRSGSGKSSLLRIIAGLMPASEGQVMIASRPVAGPAAEVASWGDEKLKAAGLGSYIADATAAGDYARVVLGIGVMSVMVVTTNRLLWRPLYRLAERRYRLD